MTFESAILEFADRFLSERTHQLIVAPALADLQFAGSAGRIARLANRVAVIRAVAGGLRDDLAGMSGSFALLALVPACYYLTMLVLFVNFFAALTGPAVVTALAIVGVLSVGPAVICCWPERRSVARVD
jgi:hypothetical protein